MLHPTREAEQEPGTPAGYLAGVFGARGYNATCLTACAASAQAIGEAVEVIRRGAADVILDGGHAQHDPPVWLDGLHPPDGDVDPERRPGPREPPLRPRP